ncbi:MAG: response regulator [Mariprofundus sp.]
MANILVTDDSSFLRRIACRILIAAGHQTTEASHGLECLGMVENNKPDVLFLDLVMPEMDGFAVLKQLREQGHTFPIIILTADIQESVKKECMQLGASAFINKPPKEDELLNTLNTALESQEASQ